MNSLCRILWSIPTRNRNVSVWFEGGGEGRVGEGGRDIFFVPCQQFRFSYSLNSCDSLVNVHTGCSLRSCLKITAFFGTKQDKQLRSICCFRLIMSLLLKKTTCKYNLMYRMNWNSWNHSSFEWHNVNLCPILPPPLASPFDIGSSARDHPWTWKGKVMKSIWAVRLNYVKRCVSDTHAATVLSFL